MGKDRYKQKEIKIQHKINKNIEDIALKVSVSYYNRFYLNSE
jgi:hypothetical protein